MSFWRSCLYLLAALVTAGLLGTACSGSGPVEGAGQRTLADPTVLAEPEGSFDDGLPTATDASSGERSLEPDENAAEDANITAGAGATTQPDEDVAPAQPPVPEQEQIGLTAFDSVTAVGNAGEGEPVYNVRVSALRDAIASSADPDAAIRWFQSEPEPGMVYAEFDLEIQLAAATSEPAEQPFFTSWVSITGGASGATYEIDFRTPCGEMPDTPPSTLLIGGSETQVVCTAIDAADLAHPDTTVFVDLGFTAQQAFGANGAAGTPAGIGEPLTDATDAFVFGETTPITNESDLVRFWSGTWDLTVETPRDVSEPWEELTEDGEVVAALGTPPGQIWIEIDVVLTLTASQREDGLAAPPGMDDVVAFGRASGRTFTPLPFRCEGSMPEGLHPVGTTLTATACLILPLEDYEHPDFVVSVSGDSGPFFGRSSGASG